MSTANRVGAVGGGPHADDGDIRSDIGSDPDDPAASAISRSVSDPGSPTSLPASPSALPDYVAILEAEFAAIDAADQVERSRRSALGVGEIVLTARELAGVSQRQLASLMGASQPSLARIESGNRLPTIRTLMRVAAASELELLIGLRCPGQVAPALLGAVTFADDGLADYAPMIELSPFVGPPT